MTIPAPSHLRIVSATGARPAGVAGLPSAPQPDISVRCHRRLRGPYTGCGTLLRELMPELLKHAADLITSRRIEITAVAPELASQLPAPPLTLTERAEGLERTRYYSADRIRRLAHGIAELLTDWAKACRPDGVVIEFREAGQADPTDLVLIGILLRRCDPRLLTIMVEGEVAEDDPHLASALATYAQPVAGPRGVRPQRAADPDLAQVFIDSDGTDTDPAVRQAYAELPADERARRHTVRAGELTDRNEPSLLLGAVPFHAERGVDAADVGLQSLYAAMTTCLNLGFYHAAMDLALRGRALIQPGRPEYVAFTHKIGACLTYLGRGPEAVTYFAEQRRVAIDAEAHMGAAYMMAMLYTRHLLQADHDEDTALEWVNTAIALADQHPDTSQRVFRQAFMRNARALIELHRKNPEGALALVDEAARLMDASYGSAEHLLHRSVLRYNRGQLLASMGKHDEAIAAYDEVIGWDPEFADYYFERAGLRRKVGWYEGAFEDYERAVSLSPPFFEVHVNRADMLGELGDDEAALRDLDYALELEPDQVDSLINRADILLARGETGRAHADICRGLSLQPGNPHLLAARAALLAESGDTGGAWASYTAALREDPGFAPAWANRAVLAYSLGRTAEAVDDLGHAIHLQDDPSLRANRAVAWQDLGEHRHALDDFNVAIAALGGQDPGLFYRRGLSHHALHDIGGALADWRVHLAAYGPSETSPYATEIERLSVGLLTPAWTSEGVA
jgi:tetratricopeptide (TPR) repeat protein